jgi:ABC-type multidrug transport system ATPase subunit
MIGNPEFLILDEPMNGLDPMGIKEMRDLLLKLNKAVYNVFASPIKENAGFQGLHKCGLKEPWES